MVVACHEKAQNLKFLMTSDRLRTQIFGISIKSYPGEPVFIFARPWIADIPMRTANFAVVTANFAVDLGLGLGLGLGLALVRSVPVCSEIRYS